MRKYSISLLLLLPFLVFSQKLDMDLIKGMKPRNIGPAGMAGRITSIDVVNSDPTTVYVGSASGGIWKSDNGGISWNPIFEDQTTASIGAIAIQQSNPSVIWAGTGEGNPRNSLNGGNGIYRSLDGGRTWKKMGLEKTRHIHRVIIHPQDPNTIFVGAIGSPWGIHPERGVYRTTDGGKTWEKILYVNDKTGAADLVIDPTNPNKLIAAMWEHYRQPWFFNSGGAGSGLYITYDGGDTWEKRTEDDGLPKGDLGRIGLAIAPSDPDRIYALVESKKNALYRSDDGGFNWQMINDKDEIGDRPFYYSDLFVDPINENRIYSVYTHVNVSVDGGKSFDRLMPDYYTTIGVHPDHHAWWIHPNDPNYIIEGNDGGLNISRDRGKTWRFVTNIPVAQFYHIAVDNELPYNVYGGLQDNGSWAGPGYVWKDQGIRNSYWQEISFGDGFDVIPDPDNSRYGYSMSQEGNVGIYDRETGYNEDIRPTAPELDTKLRFNWNAAIAQDPFDNNTIYFGSQFVHKSTDKGQTWSIISPDLTTNDKTKQRQDESGGLTMDATGAENFCTLLAISPSPLDDQVIWATTDDGKIQLTRDDGKTWTNVARNIKGLPAFAWIPQIKVSNRNAGEALVVVNNYRNFDYTPYAWRTSDFGKTWERIVDGNDVTGYTLSIIQDPEEPKLMFLGTDDGLYVSIDEAATWTKWTNEFPTVNVMDLVIHPREQDLVIGTFGRAVWILDDIRPLRAIAGQGPSLLKKTLQVFTPPTAYLAASQQPTGTRFGANGMFNGENRSDNAIISYVITKPEKEESSNDDSESKAKKDTLTLKILKDDGTLIRTLTPSVPDENGLNKIQWRLNERGVGSLTRQELDTDNEPGGVKVMPGTYKLQLSYRGVVSETSIEVKPDPRLSLTMMERQAIFDSLKKLESDKEFALFRVENIKKSLGTVEELIQRMEEKDEKGFKYEIELSKHTRDTLNSFLDLYLGKEDEQQGITADQPNTVNNYYNMAENYLSNALHAPTTTEVALTRKFQSSMMKANDLVDTYFEKEWPVYRKEMEQLDLSPFKD